jgi:pilus assembly protein Flp/PilA
MKKFMKILKDVSGASAAEYALILAIVGAAIAIAAFNLGGVIATAMDDAAALIEDPNGAGGGSPSPSPSPSPAP